MESTFGGPIERTRLAGIVRGVRTRWRLRRALRGAAIVVAASFVILMGLALLLDSANYSEASVLGARVGAVLAVVGLIIRFIVAPLLPRVRDEQVAMYVEEHEAALEGALLTAVELQASGRAPRSAALADRLARSAVERAGRVQDGRMVDAGGLRTAWITLAAVSATALAITLFGPVNLRHGLRLLVTPFATAEASPLYRISVEPGDLKVARGGDVIISARLRGFESDQVELLFRPADSTSWARVPMTPDSLGTFTARLLDVNANGFYAVESNGVRSDEYDVEVVDLPFVESIAVEYRYPGYTGLEPTRDSTGDIAAVKGTFVRLMVQPTMATSGGRVVLEGGTSVPLSALPDGSLVAMLRVNASGFYRVELAGPDGRLVTGSLDYTIDALPDLPPTVRFATPGRDLRVMAVDEVFSEVVATDDYGVARVDLVYSVNGADERAIPLHAGTARTLREIGAGHTFMLEEYRLVPGDVVSYYARALDNDAISGAKSATTDIYFLTVRPFAMDYRQGQAQPPGQGGQPSQEEEQAGSLAKQQRDIIAATFRTVRDSARTDAEQFGEDVAAIRLAQQKLREQTATLANRLVERGIAAQDSNYRKISLILPRATAEMDIAERLLGERKPGSARQHEERALKQLQEAEAVFREIMVQQQQQGGGGGGGSQQSSAEDLADIFELERESMRNPYEQVQRGAEEQQQQAEQLDRERDAAAERLRQLAARQQQENERMRRKADSLNRQQPGASGSGGGGSQRELADQAAEAARQLERLARERGSQAMEEAARRLQEAANAMRQAAAGSGQQSAAAAQNATNQLESARRLMDQERQQLSQQSVDDAVRAGQRLAQQNARMSEQVNRMAAGAGDTAAARAEVARQSGQMANDVRQLSQQLDRLATGTQRDQPNTARALRAAADSLRQSDLETQLRRMQEGASGRTIPSYLRDAQQPRVTAGVENLNRQLERAARAAQQSQAAQAQNQAVDRARNLVRGVESLAERAEQQGQQQQGQQQQGQQQQGQQGQQGQGGRPQNAQSSGGRSATGGGGGNPAAGQVDPRQLGLELQQRLNEAQSLRNDLARQGMDVSQLDRAISQMRGVSNLGSLDDPRAAAALKSQALDGLKDFEFALRRAVEGEQRGVRVGRTGEVPPAYRDWVADYYRRIGRAPPP